MSITTNNIVSFQSYKKQRLTFKAAEPIPQTVKPDPLNKSKIDLANVDSIGWVFSGGGAKGVFEVGVACALAKTGMIPDVIVGTSVGALNAAAMADGNLDKAVDIWKGISKKKVYSSRIVKIITESAGQIANWIGIRNSGKLRSILDNKPLRKLVEEKVDTGAILDTNRPGHVELMLGVTALNDGKEGLFATPKIYRELKDQYEKNGVNKAIELTPDNFVDAVIASSSIPIAFPPVQIDQEIYVDGGTGNNTPARNGVDALFALNKDIKEGLLFVVLLEPPEKKGDLTYENADVATVGFKTLNFMMDSAAKGDIKTTQVITAEIERWLGAQSKIQDGITKIGKTAEKLQQTVAELLKLSDSSKDEATKKELKTLADKLATLGSDHATDTDKVKEFVDGYQPFNGKKKIQVVIIRPQQSFGVDTLEFDKAGKNAESIIKMGYETTLNALLSTNVISKEKYDELINQKPYPVGKKFPDRYNKKLEQVV